MTRHRLLVMLALFSGLVACDHATKFIAKGELEDQPPATLVRGVLDRADRNVVRANRFTDVTYGVRVEDDHTTVDANWFQGSTPDRHAVVIGTPYRTARLGLPVRGTVLTRNVSTIAGNPSPYRWVEGEADTVVRANVALGRFVGICEGQPLPRQPFIFAIAVAPANADGTAPAAPDLTVPTVGALPACG